MPDQIATLKRRIDLAAQERATLVERKRRAEEDKAKAEANLKELGLTPKNAEAKIKAEYEELESLIADIEEALGL